MSHSLYTDRGSHYFHTPEAGGKVAAGAVTQVGRALAQLGIEPIAAYSPEARGRSERAFRTLQDRLPKELALAGVTDIEAANRYIHEVYLPALERPLRNEAGRRAKAPSRRWRRPNGATSSCIQEERVVAPDNKSPGTAGACRFRLIPHGGALRARQAPHHSPNDELAVFHGPRRLVRWLASQEDDTIPLSPAA